MIFFQLLVVLVSGLLCLSLQCQDEVFTNDLKYTSCEEILTKFPDTPSGYYVLADSAEKVYCDMENKRCGSQGWTRVAYVNMSSEMSKCPGNFNLYKTPISSCGGNKDGGCAVAHFSTHGITYSQVCGRVVGYQVGRPNAFSPYTRRSANLDNMMDGILISHGETREHVWAYVTGFQRMPTKENDNYCPCASNMFNGIVPAFIGNDYYCDSGVDDSPSKGMFYTDPLWIGKGCKPPNFCCSSASLPWFCKTLADPTNDDIEIRNCHNQQNENEDTAVQLIELYVH
ncbi:uncharacterized protein [Dysidea avara]|uniref:uncharacterized protein n=1 Tax=Dysidea avara TaxID=196820 RepID=UPI00331F5257